MQALEAIGWDAFFQEQAEALGDPALVPARVMIEYQDRYRLLGADGPSWGVLSGNLRHEAELDRLRRPAVGDWVAVRPATDDERGSIVHLFERRTCFVRQAAGRRVHAQVVAANIDTVFVVTSCNRDFNPRRLERYLTTVARSGARAVVVLNKADLSDDPARFVSALDSAGAPVVMVSALERRGLDQLEAHLAPGQTAALVGSSGVGKSTLVNWLLGDHVQSVGALREDDDRGRHTTTHRELLVMPGGAVLIDTPGMRELQLWSDGEGLGEAFADIEAVAQGCRFRDCSHQGEPGCAIADAVRRGELEAARLHSYLKLLREQESQRARQQPGAERQRGKRGAKQLRQHRRLGDD